MPRWWASSWATVEGSRQAGLSTLTQLSPCPGKVDAGEVHAAHQAGKGDGLDPRIIELQKGNRTSSWSYTAGLSARISARSTANRPFSVPGHIIRCRGHLAGEVARHRQQVLLGHRLGGDAGAVLKESVQN